MRSKRTIRMDEEEEEFIEGVREGMR